MRFSRMLGFVAMAGDIALAGCGNSCFGGFSNNGSGGFIINSGNTPAACLSTQTPGKMSVVARKSPACETCTNAARVENVFVTLRSIDTRPRDAAQAGPGGWVEIASFASAPRQMDLIGDAPEVLAKNVVVPVGSYGEVRVRFYTGPPETVAAHAANACSATQWNCVTTADGRVEPLLLLSDTLEIAFDDGSLFVLPGSTVDLELDLQPRSVYVLGPGGLKPQNTISGQITAYRRP